METKNEIGFKVGDLVTINPYGTITDILPTLREARITFDTGDEIFVPFDYLCPAPVPERAGTK